MPVISDRFLGFLCANLPKLAEKFGDPYIIYHGPEIKDRVWNINRMFGAEGLDFLELFALKALPRLEVFKHFIFSEGCGSDCSSEDELLLSEEVGVPGDRIMLTANNVPEGLYRLAMRLGGHLNLDDITCFGKVPDPFPRSFSCRVNLGKILLPGEERGKIEFSKEGAKFGIPYTDIMEAYRIGIEERRAKEAGIHGMMLSNNLYFQKAIPIIERQAEIISDVADRFSVHVPYINIGGGLGIAYKPDDPEYDVRGLAHGCGDIVRGFEKKHGYKPKVFMESGRYITGPSGVLVNRIQNVYTKFGHKFLGVQIAMHAVPRPMLYPGEAYHHHFVVSADGTIKDGPLETVSLVGSACEDNDRIGTNIQLPKAKEGDYLFTCSAGAHCVDQGSDYNWQRKPQELLIYDDGIVRRICSAADYKSHTARQRGLEGREHLLELH